MNHNIRKGEVSSSDYTAANTELSIFQMTQQLTSTSNVSLDCGRRQFVRVWIDYKPKYSATLQGEFPYIFI